jgi:hypothetical protein
MLITIKEKDIKEAIKDYCTKNGVVVNDCLKDISIKKGTGDKYATAFIYVNRSEEERQAAIDKYKNERE